MEISLRYPSDKVIMVDLAGDFDLYSSPKVRKTLLDLARKRAPGVIVNLGKVEYMDSSGIATLIEALRAMSKYGGKLVLTDLNLKTWEVIKLARLERIFQITADENEALASLESSQGYETADSQKN